MRFVLCQLFFISATEIYLVYFELNNTKIEYGSKRRNLK